MKVVHILKKYTKCAILVAALLVGLSMGTIRVKAMSYAEKIDGVTWVATVEGDVVSIEPACFCALKGSCVIPDTIQGFTVNRISEKAFKSCTTIKEVTIPDSVEVIGDKAFEGCQKLTTVNLSKNITKISNRLFYGCVNLKTVEIPESVTSIGTSSFEGCKKLSGIDFPNKLSKIGNRSFYGCKSIQTVSFPRSVKTVGTRAFAECGIVTAYMPRELKNIKEDIYYGDHDLDDIYYMGTKKQWYATEGRRLADPGFDYADYVGYHITVHYLVPELIQKMKAYTYELNASDVEALSVSADVTDESMGRFVKEIEYQWYVSSVNDKTTGEAIEGATGTEFVPPVDELGVNYYYCEATFAYDNEEITVLSKSAKITVIKPTVSEKPVKSEEPVVSEEPVESEEPVVSEEPVASEEPTVEPEQKQYEVVFIPGKDFGVPTQKVVEGSVAKRPVLDIEDEYLRIEWYLDADLSREYNFEEPVMSNITLYPKTILNYEELKNAVDAANVAKKNSSYISRYTSDSVQKYTKAVQLGENMLTAKSAESKQELLNMIASVKNAKKMLIIKPEERPIPLGNDKDIYVDLHSSNLVIHKYVNGVGFNEERFNELYAKEDAVKGAPEENIIRLDKSDFYTFAVTDAFGDDFYLVAYYDSENGLLDLSQLAYELQQDQVLCDTTPVNVQDLGTGVSYTDEASKKKFQQVIDYVASQFNSIKNKSDADSLLRQLRQAETEFRNSIVVVDWVNVIVKGSTVSVVPKVPYRIGYIEYIADENGNLVQGYYTNDNAFRLNNKVVMKTEDYVWTDVADGYYTFVISLRTPEGGYKWGMKRFCVSNNAEPDQIAADYLQDKIKEAEELLASQKKASDVELGEICVPDAIYNYLESTIQEAKALIQKGGNAARLTEVAQKLSNSVLDFTKNIGPKEEPDYNVEINVEGTKISIKGKDLYKCSMAKGDYDCDEDYLNAKFTSFNLGNGAGSLVAGSDGVFTIRCLFKDNHISFEKVTIGNMLKAEEKDGKIVLSYQGTQNIISTAYAFDDGSDNLTFKKYNGFQKELMEIGKGTHVIKVTYGNGEDSVLRVDATAISEPFIRTENNELIVYGYGFDIKTVLYAKGHFTSWEEMHENVVNLEVNKATSIMNFEKGQEYTFYLQDNEGNITWIYKTF